MKKILLAAAVLAVAPALAQPVPTILPNPTNPEAQAPRPDRAHGIPTELAIEAATTANATCKAQNPPTITTTVVTDSEGTPIVVISNDGAKAITQRIAQGKAMIALAAKGPSNGAKVDAALGSARPGGFPLMAGGTVVGAIAVSGSPSGATDEICAKAAIAKIQDRIK
jgi:uncharacterized protein GlcG (DUF336 family)